MLNYRLHPTPKLLAQLPAYDLALMAVMPTVRNRHYLIFGCRFWNGYQPSSHTGNDSPATIINNNRIIFIRLQEECCLNRRHSLRLGLPVGYQWTGSPWTIFLQNWDRFLHPLSARILFMISPSGLVRVTMIFL